MALPSKLQEIADDFASMSREETLESLLAYAEMLPDLPERLRPRFAEMEDVPECMTPVRLLAEKQADGSLLFYFDIPRQSPTVRGLASILASGLNGVQPEEILAVPAEFYLPMRLEQVISQQRITGFVGVLAHMKHAALEAMRT